jgi:hypothetical protein
MASMARNAFLAAATAIALLPGQAMAAAGAFLLATGDVQVRDVAGTLRTAKTGMEVNSGETILTQSGRAQVHFTDSGQISLQPGTEFKIADYRFHEAGKQEESAVFSLIKGGVRAITGLVGRRAKTDYQMDTVVATIGIRGTEYQAVLCASSCKEPDGLYVQTGEGTVFVKNALGEVDVGRGQTAYVASAQSAPQRTSAGPSMSSTPPLTQPPALPGVTEPGFQPGTIITSNPLGPVTELSSAGFAATASGTGSTTFEGITYSGSGIGQAGAAAGQNTTGGAAVVGAYINGSQVNGFVVSGSGAFASIYFSSVLNAANNGELYWGRWSGGNATLYAGLNGISASATVAVPASVSLHYILGTSVPTIPASGSFSFSFVGGTPSTNASGATGSGITGGTVSGNFQNTYVSSNFTVVQGSTYNVSSVMPVGSNRAQFASDRPNGYVDVNGSRIANGIAANGTAVAGFFTGTSSPTGAGLSYSIKSGTVSIVGVGAFR